MVALLASDSNEHPYPEQLSAKMNAPYMNDYSLEELSHADRLIQEQIEQVKD